LIKFKNDNSANEYTSLLGFKKSENSHIKIKDNRIASLINTKDFKLTKSSSENQIKV